MESDGPKPPALTGEAVRRPRRRDVLRGATLGAAAVALAACTPSGGDRARHTGTSSPGPRTAVFPAGFAWGVATSAFQVEGATTADGRGPSIWDTFSHRSGAVADGSTADRACDHYHRMDADLDLMKSLGVTSYRFSVAWPRVMPRGRGEVNPAGLGFYDRLVDGLASRGIQAVATLYHWDLPQALQDAGGWENRDSTEWFADYTAVVARSLGDRVTRWLTINEAKIIAQQGYQTGQFAPGWTDRVASGRVIHHLGLAHGRAVQVLRAQGVTGPVGPCLQLAPCSPADDSAEAKQATDLADVTENTLYLDPVLRGSYPTALSAADPEVARGIATALRSGDLETISTPVDFLGVNYYSPQVLGAAGPITRYPPSAAGWQQIYPSGLTDVLLRLHHEYGSPEVVVTENGVPDAHGEDLHDPSRIAFLRDHLLALHDAMAGGAKVRGFHAWSLMDNFEWSNGYSQRWGLVRVDFDTLRRTPKDSAGWYRKVATSNQIHPA
jgi:beta-glucosidase